MKDICFIYLPHPYLKRPDAQLPIGILMLAAVIKKDCRYSVVVKNYSSFTMEAAIEDLSESKVFGITATSMEMPYANDFARGIKRKYPSAKVILGGPGAVIIQHADLRYIDSVVQGEAEDMIFDILKYDEQVWQCKEALVLDRLPFPARNMVSGELGGGIFAYEDDQKPSTQMLTARGCPFNCAFCASKSVCKTVRYRSCENVRKEIKQIIREYDIRRFRFADDLFTVPRDRAIELCEYIGDLDIEWRVSARAKPIDEDLLSIMKDTGCKEISFGIESFDDDVLGLLNKKATVEDNVRALKLADIVGLDARILLMVGTPGQTKKTLELNKKYVDELPHTIVACTTFVPVPGSAVWYDPDKYGIEILSRDMKDYNFYFFGSNGMNDLKPIIKPMDRPLEEFMAETKEFRQWLFEREDVNRG